MEKWLIFAILYAVFNGIYNCVKKKAIEKNTVYEVLAMLSTLSFLLIATITRDAFNIDFKYLWIIIVKSLVVTLTWLFSLKAIKNLSVSVYSIIYLSNILFTIALSVLFLNETITLTLLSGIIIIIIGLILVNKISNKSGCKDARTKPIILLLISCFFSAVSSIIDKVLLGYVNCGQLQFWYLLFSAIMFWVVLLCNKQKPKINAKALIKNYWIVLLAGVLVIADKLFFMSAEIPESKMSIITSIKQLAVIETIILGKIMFKEKNIIKKLLCAILVIAGVVLTIV
jgi:uncharacterized membrane protein